MGTKFSCMASPNESYSHQIPSQPLFNQNEMLFDPETQNYVRLYCRDSCQRWNLVSIKRHKNVGQKLQKVEYKYLRESQKKNISKLNKLAAIFVHYEGWTAKWDEWVFITDDIFCDCNIQKYICPKKHRLATLKSNIIIKWYAHERKSSQFSIKISIKKNWSVQQLKLFFCKTNHIPQQFVTLEMQDKKKQYIKLNPEHSISDYIGNVLYCRHLLLSSHSCSFSTKIHSIMRQAFPDYVKKWLSVHGSKCFCNKCCDERKDEECYNRGQPAKTYVLPRGFYRFAIDVSLIEPQHSQEMKNIFKTWHRSYHGTKYENCLKIFKSGLQLKKPGDIVTTSSAELVIKPIDHHIQKTFERYNEYTKKKEIFNPQHCFTSPSMKYASNTTYAKNETLESKSGKCYEIQVVFQCLQKPDSYNIGQQTINAKYEIDKYIGNNEIEWYTANSDLVIYGLLIRYNEKSK